MRIFALVLLLLPTSAWSLSCAVPDEAQSYLWAAESESKFRAVVGTFNFDQTKIAPQDPDDPQPKNQSFSATFKGKTLRAGRFSADYETPVEITFGCLAVWCGGLQPDIPYLTFLNVDTKIPTLAVGPCGGPFPNPSQKQIKIIERCASGGRCKPVEY